jgi:hypothetical protein
MTSTDGWRTLATIIEPTTYKGWAHCWRISNGDIELIVTADVGPRVIRCGVPGGRNFFKTFDGQVSGLRLLVRDVHESRYARARHARPLVPGRAGTVDRTHRPLGAPPGRVARGMDLDRAVCPLRKD